MKVIIQTSILFMPCDYDNSLFDQLEYRYAAYTILFLCVEMCNTQNRVIQ